jgi:hypothetical protein
MSADTLTASSRHFFERTKGKLATSIFAAAFGMMFLGFCSVTGGQSQSASDNAKNASGDLKDSFESLQSGYGKPRNFFFRTKDLYSLYDTIGFAAFCFIISFLIMISGAIYISPLFCGTNNEKKMIRSPQEVDSGKI